MRNLLRSGLRRLSPTPESTRPLGAHHATVIAVATQKGGVGKTTTAVNLATALARFHDQRVLLIDLDPQGHVATSLRSVVHLGGGSLASVFTDAAHPEVMDIVAHTDVPGLDVTPYDAGLATAEELLGTRIGKELVLREALQTTRTHYDVIVIDCPPNLGNLSVNALAAADRVLVPCDPSPLALNGVNALLRTVAQIADRLNPDIDLLGILLTRIDGRNTRLNLSIVNELTAQWGEAMLPVQIGVNASLGRAQAEGRDIFDVDPFGRGAQQYAELADQVVQRLSR